MLKKGSKEKKNIEKSRKRKEKEFSVKVEKQVEERRSIHGIVILRAFLEGGFSNRNKIINSLCWVKMILKFFLKVASLIEIILAKMQNSSSMFYQYSFQSFNFAFIHFSFLISLVYSSKVFPSTLIIFCG